MASRDNTAISEVVQFLSVNTDITVGRTAPKLTTVCSSVFFSTKLKWTQSKHCTECWLADRRPEHIWQLNGQHSQFTINANLFLTFAFCNLSVQLYCFLSSVGRYYMSQYLMTMTNLDLDIFNFGENWAAIVLYCRVHLKCLCTVHMHWHSTSEMFKFCSKPTLR